jgi:Spy/CpxP family protein refolding chaperone
MAKAAELNLYPGPAHVLTLAKQLKLSGDQIGKTQAIYDRMNAAARSLGVALIAHERNLDRLFATHQATPQGIAAETDAVGALQGHLRAVHLTAHVEMLALLTPEQIEIYNQLRGYGGVTQPHHHGG